jgi:hypothetical protein
VISHALVQTIERENADVTLIEGLTARGAFTLRGRDTPLDLWAGGALSI